MGGCVIDANRRSRSAIAAVISASVRYSTSVTAPDDEVSRTRRTPRALAFCKDASCASSVSRVAILGAGVHVPAAPVHECGSEIQPALDLEPVDVETRAGVDLRTLFAL
jgi:hypothetical protein